MGMESRLSSSFKRMPRTVATEPAQPQSQEFIQSLQSVSALLADYLPTLITTIQSVNFAFGKTVPASLEMLSDMVRNIIEHIFAIF